MDADSESSELILGAVQRAVLLEEFVGAGELPLIPILVAAEDFGGGGAIDEGAKATGGAPAGSDSGGVLFVDFVLECSRFEGPDAHGAPAGDDHGFDAGEFELIAWGEQSFEIRDKASEEFGVFVVKEHGEGEPGVPGTATHGSIMGVG